MNTPDEALGKLARFHTGLGNEYVWMKTKTTDKYADATYTNSIFLTTYTAYGGRVLYYGDTIETNSETGLFTIVEPSQVTASTGGNDLSVLKGKYFTENSAQSSVCKYIPLNATVSYFNTGKNSCEYSASEWHQLSNIEEYEQTVGFVNAPASDAYPPAEADGYNYIALGQLGEKVRIETGTYTGTGTYGSSNPNRLTFGFEPKLVIVSFSGKGTSIGSSGLNPAQLGGWLHSFVYQKGQPNAQYGNNAQIFFTLNGNTLSWYSDNGGFSAQCNYSGAVYSYIALG